MSVDGIHRHRSGPRTSIIGRRCHYHFRIQTRRALKKALTVLISEERRETAAGIGSVGMFRKVTTGGVMFTMGTEMVMEGDNGCATWVTVVGLPHTGALGAAAGVQVVNRMSALPSAFALLNETVISPSDRTCTSANPAAVLDPLTSTGAAHTSVVELDASITVLVWASKLNSTITT